MISHLNLMVLVGEASNIRLLELQKKLIQDTLKDQSLTIQDRSQEINVIKEILF